MGSGHSTTEATPGIGARAAARLRERERRRAAKSARALRAHQRKRELQIRRQHSVNKRHAGHLELDRFADAIENRGGEARGIMMDSLVCKVAIIGPRRSGKSSVFRRFLNNTFALSTQHDTSANFGLRLIELEGLAPIWFEVWDLPTHVPIHGDIDDGSSKNGVGQDGIEDPATQFAKINAWETHKLESYRDELKREHTDPSTGLVRVLKKDHDAVLLTIEASAFTSYDLDDTIDALLMDAAFLNDHTEFEVMRVILVTKCDLLSDEEMEGVLIQVRSVAEDKGLDFVTVSSRFGTKSIRDLFKYVAMHTVVQVDAAKQEHASKQEQAATGAPNAIADGWEDAKPAPLTHDRSKLIGSDMSDLFTLSQST
eukprot:g995.t1